MGVNFGGFTAFVSEQWRDLYLKPANSLFTIWNMPGIHGAAPSGTFNLFNQRCHGLVVRKFNLNPYFAPVFCFWNFHIKKSCVYWSNIVNNNTFWGFFGENTGIYLPGSTACLCCGLFAWAHFQIQNKSQSENHPCGKTSWFLP